ncbi:cytochrome b/b6 domain-containing protein [Pseudocitrobacter sp. 73]|uniref:cytochrome b/b6 domain-containing protein n=1 Tax=Pseudocitrobacter sp. 73 TaxID=2605731 RepID=UPI0011EC69EA|nr:cytochrome b/b6 domain-containing protein [Pseudocitrobacter sp. 73]KAA1048577.1 cytochrome B [Pseudocitrobacter sp. 73]
MTNSKENPLKIIHPLWLRISHWINALAMLIMITSGWRIYNASPLFHFVFPDDLTLGGWLGGALQWHFAAMWLFVLNGIFYLICNICTGRLYRMYWPLSLKSLLQDITLTLRGKLSHQELSQYNMIQKFAYSGVILLCILTVLSGLVIWKSVQFPLLRELMGGYEQARLIHFSCMSLVLFFIAIHLLMVVLVPKTLIAMIRGR